MHDVINEECSNQQYAILNFTDQYYNYQLLIYNSMIIMIVDVYIISRLLLFKEK